MTNTDTIYTKTTGTTCYINGERGTVTGITYKGGEKASAFVLLDMSREMLHVTLGATVGERDGWNEVQSVRVIDRDDFDRITGLSVARVEMGWAA